MRLPRHRLGVSCFAGTVWFFADCVIRDGTSTSGDAFLFLFAMQNPCVSFWLPLSGDETADLHGHAKYLHNSDLPISLDGPPYLWRHHWRYKVDGQYLFEWVDLPFRDRLDDIEVIAGSSCIGGCQVVSDMDAMPWSVFTQDCQKRGGSGGRSSSKIRASKDILEAHPWVAECCLSLLVQLLLVVMVALTLRRRMS